jgi:hypothetical protein
VRNEVLYLIAVSAEEAVEIIDQREARLNELVRMCNTPVSQYLRKFA